jgi:hypothetical protein
MAYIVGIVSDEEYNVLKRRGWDIEDPPDELRSDVDVGMSNVMIWVDVSVFDVMNGPDWDKGEENE